MKKTQDNVKNIIITFFKWIILATVIGTVVGAVSGLFGRAIHWSDETLVENPYLILGLPFIGLFIVLMYKLDKNNSGVDIVMQSVKSTKQVPKILAPLIIVATFLSHLFGASVGKEGAALQLGGSISNAIGRVYKLKENSKRVAVMSGMSAAISALFGAPVGAALFPIAIMNVGTYQFAALIPCLIAAIIASQISIFMGNSPEQFLVEVIPEVGAVSIIQVIVLALICGVVSAIFCKCLHGTSKVMKNTFKNPYLRIFVGGAVIVVITLIIGNFNYSGGGGPLLEKAFEEPSAFYEFAIKILLTCLAVGCGFRGGEIMPSLFIGATLGSALSVLLGLPVGLAAGCGLTAVFCGVTNAPLTAIFFAVEFMGADGIIFYALSAIISYFISGYYGLYKEQTFEFSKYEMKESHVHTK